MRVVEATHADLGAITQIYAHHVRTGTGTFEIAPPDLADMRHRFTDLWDRGMPTLVAREGDVVLGYAYANTFRPREAYRYFWEDSIYMAPEAAGRGHGATLLSALIEACEARGARQLLAVIGDSENLASIRVHARAGFEHTGILHRAGWKFGRWLDVVLMQRALGPSAGPDPTT